MVHWQMKGLKEKLSTKKSNAHTHQFQTLKNVKKYCWRGVKNCFDSSGERKFGWSKIESTNWNKGNTIALNKCCCQLVVKSLYINELWLPSRWPEVALKIDVDDVPLHKRTNFKLRSTLFFSFRFLHFHEELTRRLPNWEKFFGEFVLDSRRRAMKRRWTGCWRQIKYTNEAKLNWRDDGVVEIGPIALFPLYIL